MPRIDAAIAILDLCGMADPAYFSPQVETARRFHLKAVSGRMRIAVASGGFERCAPGYVVERGHFPFFTVEMIVRGRGEARLGARVWDLGPGSVFCYGPRMPHRIASAGGPMEKWFLACAPEGATRVFSEYGLRPGVHGRVAPGGLIAALWGELVDAALGDRAGRAELCGAVAEVLVSRIGRDMVAAGGPPDAAQATFMRCRAVIEARFEELETLGAAAAACHVDPAYLCRLFRRFGGESPYRFLQHLRMNRAAEWLAGTGLPVKAVAGKLRLEDPFHFSRLFRRVMGVSPSEFRRRRGVG